MNPVRIAIFGCRFAERPKKAFGLTLEVRFEQMGSDGHVDSAIESANFQQLFSGRFGKLNCTLVRAKRTGSGAHVRLGQEGKSTNGTHQIESFSGTESGTELLKTGWRKRG
jgi:hypothetical protein